MSPLRYHDEESTSNRLVYLGVGALVGLAAGIIVAERFGGFRAISTKLREQFAAAGLLDETDSEIYEAYDDDEFEGVEGAGRDFDSAGIATAGQDYDDDDLDVSHGEELEERVLEAFRNDPVMCERPVDIGAISDGIIELTGWVNAESEAAHAVTLSRGVPGVDTVVNRLAVRPEEDMLDETARRYADGDPTLTEAHWEGQSMGTGKRRQGNSTEPDRHADPRPALEERWTSAKAALDQAVDDVAGLAERPKPPSRKRGGRADGSSVAPGGVPKADHVAAPMDAPGSARGD